MTQQFPQQQPPHDPWQQQAYPPPQPPKKKSPWTVILALGIPFLMCVIGIPIGLAIGQNKDSDTRTAVATTSAAPRVGTIVNPSAEAEASAAASTLAEAEAEARQDESRYTHVDDREWKVIARNPDAYRGKWYRIYGVVTQADSATGTTALRMSTEGTVQEESYEYTVNTVVRTTTDAPLADIVERDVLKMFVEVVGSTTYSTTVGGSRTAPTVKVYKAIRLV